MTADGYYVEAAPDPCPTCSGSIRETVGMVCQTCGTDYGRPAERARRAADEWQDRHADLATTLRTILAMCDQPGIVLSSGTHLARSIRAVIEGATDWPGR